MYFQAMVYICIYVHVCWELRNCLKKVQDTKSIHLILQGDTKVKKLTCTSGKLSLGAKTSNVIYALQHCSVKNYTLTEITAQFFKLMKVTIDQSIKLAL